MGLIVLVKRYLSICTADLRKTPSCVIGVRDRSSVRGFGFDGAPVIVQLKTDALIVTGRELKKLLVRTALKAQRIAFRILIACPIALRGAAVTGQKCGPGAVTVPQLVKTSLGRQPRTIRRVILALVYGR